MIKHLDEVRSKDLLRCYDIMVVPGMAVKNLDEARKTANKLGYPVSLKVVSDKIPHKWDVGGVILDIKSDKELKYQWDNITNRFPDVESFLLSVMMDEPIAELILGCKMDPVFGPVMMVGIGGIYTEVIKDTQLFIGKPEINDGIEMINKLNGLPILKGARGKPIVNLSKIASVLTQIYYFIYDHPEVCELDINPLFVYENECYIIDAIISLSDYSYSFDKIQLPQKLESVIPFFEPVSIAIIGASANKKKAGNIILNNFLRGEYSGKIFLVNPKEDEIEGIKAYKTTKSLPAAPDLAIVVIPNDYIEDIVSDLAAIETKNIIICSGGFSDSNELGREREKEIIAFARKNDIRIMGPNSIGVINTENGLCTSITSLPKLSKPSSKGGIALCGQTGVFGSGFPAWAADMENYHFSKISCLGNKGDINECDVMEYLIYDDSSACVGLYLEGVLEGDRFRKLGLELSKKMPVVVIKAGKTDEGIKTITSHTGTLAGEDRVFNALFNQLGWIRVESFTQMFTLLKAFELCNLPASGRLGVVSITGVGCVLSADLSSQFCLELPNLTDNAVEKMHQVIPDWAPVKNPVDIWSAIEKNGAYKAYSTVSKCLLESTDIDILILIFVLIPESDMDFEKFASEIKELAPDKTILACYFGGEPGVVRSFINAFETKSIPVYSDVLDALYAAGELNKRRFWLEIKH